MEKLRVDTPKERVVSEKHINDIKGLLDVDKSHQSEFNQKVIDEIIKAVLSGKTEKALKILDLKSRSENGEPVTIIPQEIKDNLISISNQYKEENNISTDAELKHKRYTNKQARKESWEQDRAKILELFDSFVNKSPKPKSKIDNKKSGMVKDVIIEDMVKEEVIENKFGGSGKGDSDEIIENKDVSKLSLVELVRRGYAFNSPQVLAALEKSKIDTEKQEKEILAKMESKKQNSQEKEAAIEKMRFENMIRDIKTLEGLGRRFKNDKEKIELWKNISEKYNLGIISIDPIKKEGNSAKEFAIQKYEKSLLEIGDIIKEGVDKVVIHGNDVYDKETMNATSLRFKNDLDTNGALYFLNDIANIKYKEGSTTEVVNKGGRSQENTGNVLYVDVGGRTTGVEKTGTGKRAFIDHHQEEYKTHETSATQITYDILVKNKIIEGEPWMENLVKFTTNMDNLQYVRGKDFDLKFFKEKWPSSLYSLAEKVPFKYLVQWFKEGRDPKNPFTEEEIKNIKIEKYSPASKTMSKHSLEGLIKTNSIAAAKSTANILFAKEQMIKNAIKTRTDELGKVLYNTTEEVINHRTGNNSINKIDINGFIPSTAMGYDTFISYNTETQKYFINSINYDLTNAYNRIKKIVPDTKLIRGVMILPPNNESRKLITPEKLLKILDLKE